MESEEGSALPFLKRRLKLRIPKEIQAEHIVKAIEEIKKIGWPPRNNSTTYDLCYEGRRYPPKIVVMYANKYVNGELFDVSKFSGGEETTNKFFRARGFEIRPKKEVNIIKNLPFSDEKNLKKYSEYSRKDVHDIFDPGSRFTLKSGTWGIRGIIAIPSDPDDFVFFVTFGRSDLGFTFEESVTENGILTWQSEPKQKISDPTIQKLIRHDDKRNSIYLFLRTHRDRNFSYMGKLAYVEHDKERDQPVLFRWKILDWNIDAKNLEDIGLELIPENISTFKSEDNLTLFIRTDPPEFLPLTSDSKPRKFVGRLVDRTVKNQQNIEIGDAGELAAIEIEKAILLNAKVPNPDKKIEHVAKTKGEGVGYDIQSETPDGKSKYIEVKTTTNKISEPFILSDTEFNRSKQDADCYYLYRLYEFDKTKRTVKYYVIEGDLSKKTMYKPVQYSCLPAGKMVEKNFTYF